MPIESACRFIRRLRSDPDFRQSLSQAIHERDLVRRSLFIRTSGFEFTASDLDAARRSLGPGTRVDLIAELDIILCGLLFLEPPRP